MDEMDEILALLREKVPDAPTPEAESIQRLEKLVTFCPVYRDFLRSNPEFTLWLGDPVCSRNLLKVKDYARLRKLPVFAPAGDAPEERKRSLRRFRRAMSMRIACRDLSGLADIGRSMKELSALADYIVRETLEIVQNQLEEKMGSPWDEESECPARFCVLALGKLGAGELNFVSDLDLIYVHDGRGNCRRGTRQTAYSNEHFFARLARDLTATLQDRTQDGFLYNVDLRLRPEGNSGPISCTATAMENYYYSSGQTWERLALMKARPIAGDNNLGGELMEMLSPFRFPRNPPSALFEEVAGLKLRIEHEVLGEENFRLNIKNGWGGIREIEFIVQALQCVYQGRYPFLQTTSTLTAMAGLERYQILSTEQVNLLCESYMWLRRVEQRLQMRNEEQTQTLPPPGSPARLQLASSLGENPERFEEQMEETRRKVREFYESYFPISDRESLVQEWTEFIAGEKPGPEITAMLDKVFWGPRETILDGLRKLALGGTQAHIVTRETAQLMIELAGTFPEALAPQAHPLRTLDRVNQYADRYRARKSFLRLCAGNQPFFKALCMLFDRSSFIHSLVCTHPEILEELMMAGALRLNKPGRIMRREVRALEGESDEETAEKLWLWIKAEQVRIAMAQVLSKINLPRVETALSKLASVTVDEMLRRVDPEGEMIAVAMGKFGAREMSFGSDLDMMLVCRDASTETMLRKTVRLQKILGYKGPLGAGFEVDMRLRPYGQDGPPVVALPALRHYHSGHGGQLWERQSLLRSRPLSDRSDARPRREETAAAYMALRSELLFETPPPENLREEVTSMRRRIEAEKTKGYAPERCFKAGPGGILDIEFIVQTLQMTKGSPSPSLQGQNTRETLLELGRAEVLPPETVRPLLENYEMLRTLEFRLRREHNSPVTRIDENADLEHSIARWMNFPDFPTLLADLSRRMQQNREIFKTLIADPSLTPQP